MYTVERKKMNANKPGVFSRVVVVLAASMLMLSGCDTADDDIDSDVDTANGDASDTNSPDTTPNDAGGEDVTEVVEADFSIEARDPAPDATAPTGTAVSVTFNADVDASTVDDTSFVVSGTNGAVEGTREVVGRDVTFVSVDPLDAESTYDVQLSTAILDVDGRPLDAAAQWSFTTGPSLEIVSIEPVDGATDFSSTDPIRVTFDMPVDPDSVTDETFQVTGRGWVDGTYYTGAFPGTIRIVSDTVVEWRAVGGALPEFGTTIQITVGDNIRSVDGDAHGEFVRTSFTTNFLSTSFYYKLRLEGRSVDYALGLNGDNPVMTLDTGASTDWYIVRLNGTDRLGIWNHGRELALDAQVGSVATVKSWTGQAGQGWELDSYGGRPGDDYPHTSTGVHFICNYVSGAQLCLKQETVDGVSGFYLNPRGSSIYSLFYFARSGPR